LLSSYKKMNVLAFYVHAIYYIKIYKFSDIKFHIVAQHFGRAEALRYFCLIIDYEIIFLKIYIKRADIIVSELLGEKRSTEKT